jgi:hypothetical protein
MTKLPKDILKKISEAEFLEKWDKESKEWVKVPIDNSNPEVQKIKEVMIAEIEINVTKEALNLGILEKSDRELD